MARALMRGKVITKGYKDGKQFIKVKRTNGQIVTFYEYGGDVTIADNILNGDIVRLVMIDKYCKRWIKV